MFKPLEKISKKSLWKILAVIILSDGTLDKGKKYFRLVTSRENSCQHDLFKQLCLLLLNQSPNQCNTQFKSGFTGKIKDYFQSTLSSINAAEKLLTLSPSYKTTCGPMSKEEYLSCPQPSAKFLFKEKEEIKWLALQTWFDFDGSITPTFRLKNKRDKRKNKTYHYYQVQFECEIRISETNPHLVEDLRQLCLQLGLQAYLKRKKNWSGIDGIGFSKLAHTKAFIERGPLTDVTISKKSNRFFGVTKKKICLIVKDIIDDPSIKKSKYFKDLESAKEYHQKMNRYLLEKAHSP
ncbi:MAG: hypothetical protein WC595_02315 [Candidatus Nanoarchaeia archaeon]